MYADAVALTAVRALPDGGLRTYTATRCNVGMWVRRAKVKGLTNTPRDSRDPVAYAILDALNEDGDIVADYAIPTADCFRYLYSKLGWRVEDDQ